MPRFRIRSLLLAVALAALILGGISSALRSPGRPYSAVHDRFDPAALFSTRPGFAASGVTGLGTFHTGGGGSFKEWRGFIRSADPGSIPPMIQEVIGAHLGKTCRGSSFVTGKLTDREASRPPDARVPSHGQFLFNEGDRHGELHVWLFPDPSGAGYVISLREWPLD